MSAGPYVAVVGAGDATAQQEQGAEAVGRVLAQAGGGVGLRAYTAA